MAPSLASEFAKLRKLRAASHYLRRFESKNDLLSVHNQVLAFRCLRGVKW